MSYESYMEAYKKYDTDKQIQQQCLKQFAEVLGYQPDQFWATKFEQVPKILYTLNYPSKVFTNIHTHSNKLGTQDIFWRDQSVAMSQKKKNIICLCCGLQKQEENVEYPENFQDIMETKNVGLSTPQFFMSFAFLGILLSVVFVLFSIAFTILNIVGYFKMRAEYANYQSQASSITSIIPWTVMRSNTIFIIQSGVVNLTMIVLLGTITFLYYFYKMLNLVQNQISITVGDFAVLINIIIPKQWLVEKEQQYVDDQTFENIKVITSINFQKLKFKLQLYLNEYYQNKTTEKIRQDKEAQKAEIASVFLCFPYQKETKSKKLRQQLDEVIKVKQQLFKEFLQKKKDQEIFKKYREKIKLYSKQFEDQFFSNLKKQEQQYKNIDEMQVFVCFQQSYLKQFFLSKIKQSLKDNLQIDTGDGKISITEAPEPEDIKWENIYSSSYARFFKYCLTFGVSIVLLAGSLSVLLLLSRYQQFIAHVTGSLLSKLTSVIIVVINIIIEAILRKLTAFENHRTYTAEQNSLAIKAITLTLLNSILVPVLKDIVNNDSDFYLNNGLAANALSLCLTNAVLPPVIKFFSVKANVMTRIKRWYYSSLSNRLTLTQEEFNKLYERQQFEVGYEYIHIVNTFLIACFYAPFQPLVILFAICGLYIMYKVQTYLFFREYKRPIPSDDTISKTMRFFVVAGPLTFAIGNLINSLGKRGFGSQIAFLLNVLACVLGLIIIIAPLQKVALFIAGFIDQQFKQGQIELENRNFYQSERLFPQTYDQSHPYTRHEAIQKQIYFGQLQNDMVKREKAVKEYYGRCKLDFEKYIQLKQKQMIDDQSSQQSEN